MISAIRLPETVVKSAMPLCRLIQLSLDRFYATAGAAQPQFDPDCYHRQRNYGAEEEQRREPLGPAPMADPEVLDTGRGVQWVLMGSPRSRKHVYAGMISKLLDVPHISMASLLRQELSPRSSLYKQIANAVNNGRLVPEDIIFGLLSKRLEDGYYRGESGFILDGIPRTKVQAEILDQMAEIDLVLNLKCPKDRHWDGKDQYCKENFQAYVEQSRALEDYYRKQRKLLDFQVGSPVETWRSLLVTLRLQDINAIRSAQTLSSGKPRP